MERPRLESRDGQQLPDHAREPLRLLRDDAEPSIGAVLIELIGVGADAGQRGLEVVADAAQEVVLGRIELGQLGVLRLDLAEQLRVADGDGDLAGEQPFIVRPPPGGRSAVESVQAGAVDRMITRDSLHERFVRFEDAHLVRTEVPPGTGTGAGTDDVEDASPAAMRSGERVPVIPELTARRVLGEVVGVSGEMPVIARPAVELPMDNLRLWWQPVAGNQDLELRITAT